MVGRTRHCHPRCRGADARIAACATLPAKPAEGTRPMTRTVSPPRWAARTGLAAACAAALLTIGLTVTGTAQAASVNPYSPAYGHAYRHGAVPTRETAAKMRSVPQAPAASANNLNYGGAVDGIGVTTGKEKVYLVFYGSQW